MSRRAFRAAVAFFTVTFSQGLVRSEEPSASLKIDEATRNRCLAILREGLRSDEFWPGMHAAEALTLAGYGREVGEAIGPKVTAEKDAQHACGLARELVRAGDLARTANLMSVLASPDSYGHVHASESLFKVWQIGDGESLRRAMASTENPKLEIMAAAALARWGNADALKQIRSRVKDRDGEIARIAAWVLARTGDLADLPALRTGAACFPDPLTRAYFEHAIAAIGDPEGRKALLKNLASSDPAIRVYAAEFAPDARAVEAEKALTQMLNDSVLDVRVRAAQALLLLGAEPSPSRLENFSRDVFKATEKNPRYSEGSILILRDGRLLYTTTEFEGSGSDFAKARIIGVESADEGRTWSSPRVLQENVGKQNVMSVTLRRLAPGALFDGPIGLFYLVKNSPSDLHVYLRVSHDEGQTFGPAVRVTTEPGYHVLDNDRVTVLSTGRLVVPVATTRDVEREFKFVSSCYLSDDQGKTWRHGAGPVSYPRRGAMEPEVLELKSGRLLMQIRTNTGEIVVSESGDGGNTWSEARPLGIRAPESPATLRRIPSTGDLLLIWNDSHRGNDLKTEKRTPLTAAISRDEGKTWSAPRDLETDAQSSYAYTSVTFHKGRALLTYYVGDGKTGRISSRFRSVPIAWFYDSSDSSKSQEGKH